MLDIIENMIIVFYGKSAIMLPNAQHVGIICFMKEIKK